MKNPVILLATVLLLAGGCKYFRKSSQNTIDTLKADTAVSLDELIDSASLYDAIDNYRAEAAAAISTPPAAPPAVSPANPSYVSSSSNRYYMIVGSYTVTANAERMAGDLRAKGYDATILPGRDNIQMVSARSYATYQESINDIARFREEVSPEAWIYVRR